MRKIMIALMAMMITIGASAQQKSGERREFNAEEMATRQADEVKKACSTTDEQYAAIYKLYLEQANEMKAERESAKSSSDSKPEKKDMSAMKEKREKLNSQIKAILTDEQFTAFQKIKKNKRGGGQGGPRKSLSE